ncbi:MAG: site-specific integrase [Burkholderiaceae bacterium]
MSMKPESIPKATTMLTSVLRDGATYREAGAPYGLGRSNVERAIKALVQQVAQERGIPALDDDALISLTRLRQFREPVLQAVRDFTPGEARPKRTNLGPEEIAAGASRVRKRSDNPHRDVALIFVLFCTGAKPIEIARLQVRDYLNRDGSVRERSELPPEAAANGRGRPLFFTSVRARTAIDAYLAERARRRLGVAAASVASDAASYRGLDPLSELFLTETGKRFEVTGRGPNDPRATCRLMIATLRLIFKRAGWTGVTSQSARRVVARWLTDKGAGGAQVGELLGLSSTRAVRRLLGDERRALETLARDLV